MVFLFMWRFFRHTCHKTHQVFTPDVMLLEPIVRDKVCRSDIRLMSFRSHDMYIFTLMTYVRSFPLFLCDTYGSCTFVHFHGHGHRFWKRRGCQAITGAGFCSARLLGLGRVVGCSFLSVSPTATEFRASVR